MRLLECIQHLIEMEKDGAELYEKISIQSSGEVAHAAARFKEEEHRHSKLIAAIGQGLEDRILTSELEFVYLSEFTLRSAKYADESLAFETRKEFFIFALQGEKDSIILYEGFKKFFEPDCKEYGLLQNLIEEERKHMFFLLKMLHEMQ